MKKTILALSLLSLVLYAKPITLTPEQEQNWQIKVEVPQSTHTLPLGEFVAQSVTPPNLLHTISLPFEAIVKKLNVAKYQKVKKGDILAEVTGTEWTAIQQKAISEAIEYRHHKHLTERKNMLCKEEIIPKKECIAANAELQADKIRVAASKALLKSYGASDAMIDKLFKDLQLTPYTHVISSVDGSIIELAATPGKSSAPGLAMFVIQAKGPLWLETNIEAQRTRGLQEGEDVHITMEGDTFDTKVLQLSPVINPENQSRQVRFELPDSLQLLPGLRTTAKIAVPHESLKIKKTSVIKDGNAQIVFIKKEGKYFPVTVKILSEDDHYYFIEPKKELENPIAVSSVAILKNLLGEGDE